MTRPSNLHGSVPAKAKAGFAHFELLRILSLFFLFVLVVRFGGWIVGTEVSWVASMAIGVVVAFPHSRLKRGTFAVSV